MRPGGPRRSGLTAADVLILLVIVVVTVLFLLMAIPRGREQARLLGCQRNLGQIGTALALYDNVYQSLPPLGELGPVEAPGGGGPPSPLRTLLETFQLPDLTALKDSRVPPPARPGEVPGEMSVPGFVCASDPNALALRFAAPISYRATTGAGASGDDGAFALGRVMSLEAIEARDGRGYTAGFCERLVGDNQPGRAALCNYRVLSGPLATAGCPAASEPSDWRGDAGSSWTRANYRSTLYNHALPPSVGPSCLASGGKTAFMGASSGHVRGVNLLLLDGSVTLVRTSIDRKVWRDFATIGPAE
jgi:hypothetical protein